MARRLDRDRIFSFSRFIWQRFVDDKCFETAGALSGNRDRHQGRQTEQNQ